MVGTIQVLHILSFSVGFHWTCASSTCRFLLEKVADGRATLFSLMNLINMRITFENGGVLMAVGALIGVNVTLSFCVLIGRSGNWRIGNAFSLIKWITRITTTVLNHILTCSLHVLQMEYFFKMIVLLNTLLRNRADVSAGNERFVRIKDYKVQDKDIQMCPRNIHEQLAYCLCKSGTSPFFMDQVKWGTECVAIFVFVDWFQGRLNMWIS